MSRFDEAWKVYFSDNRRFADIMNMFCYHGEQVVSPEDVKEADSGQGRFMRDVVRKVVFGQKVMICGIENQEKLDYSLAARIMGYDHREYEKQIRKIKRRNKNTFEKGGNYSDPGEYMYNFLKTDRLDPVGTIVIYSGGKWAGPKSLWELCGLDKTLGQRLRIVNDYPLHILEITELADEKLEQLRSDLRQVFSVLKNLGKRDKIKEVTERIGNDCRLTEDANELLKLYCGKDFLNDDEDEEVEKMPSIRENFERMMQRERDEAKEEVREEIREEAREEGIKVLVEDNIDEHVPEERIIAKLMKYFKLSKEDAGKYFEKFAGQTV